MTDFIKIAAVAAVTVLVTELLKNINKGYALFAAVTAGSALILISLDKISIIKNVFSSFSFLTEENLKGTGIFFRCVAISIVSSLTQELCRDSGNLFLASCIDFSSRAAVLLTALPLLEGVTDIIRSCIGE